MSSRSWAVLGGGLLLGLVAGLVIALLQPVRYRAEASVVVAPAVKRTDPALSTMTRTVASLARSDSVARNVIGALHLGESAGSLRSDIGAHAHTGSALVTLTADQPTALGAERVLQQVAVVLQRLAASRLAGAVPGQLVVWDAPSGTAHALGRPYAPWILGGGSVGLLLACAALFVPRPRRRRPVGGPVVEEASDTPVPDTVREAPAPVPEPEPEPELEPAGHLAELHRRLEAEPDPARQAEMHIYLEQLAPFAATDGSLPSNLIGLAEEVFGPIA